MFLCGCCGSVCDDDVICFSCPLGGYIYETSNFSAQLPPAPTLGAEAEAALGRTPPIIIDAR